MSASGYFRRQERELEELRAHGFSHYPTNQEMLEYLFATSDKLRVLCEVLGVSIEEEFSGCWSVRTKRGEADGEKA